MSAISGTLAATFGTAPRRGRPRSPGPGGTAVIGGVEVGRPGVQQPCCPTWSAGSWLALICAVISRPGGMFDPGWVWRSQWSSFVNLHLLEARRDVGARAPLTGALGLCAAAGSEPRSRVSLDGPRRYRDVGAVIGGALHVQYEDRVPRMRTSIPAGSAVDDSRCARCAWCYRRSACRGYVCSEHAPGRD